MNSPENEYAKLDSCLNDVTAFLKADQDTLTWLRNKSATYPRLKEMHVSASDSLSRQHGARKSFGANLNWTVSQGKREFVIHVGGLVHVEDSMISNVSYCVCVTGKEKESCGRHETFRKLHFDYACPRVKRDSAQPLFHVQTGGKHMPALRDSHRDAAFNWLESPRILYTPMSLALTLHLVFWEFPHEDTDKLREDGFWRNGRVLVDQNRILRPYISNWLAIASKGGIITDEAYVS